MKILKQEINLKTGYEGELTDITDNCRRVVEESKFNDGMLFLFVPGSTAALTTIEYEEGLIKDFPTTLARLVPENLSYEHEKKWHDGNGRSHVKASLLKPDLAVPFSEQELTLGTWQQIVFVELDTRPRNRTVVAQLIGE